MQMTRSCCLTQRRELPRREGPRLRRKRDTVTWSYHHGRSRACAWHYWTLFYGLERASTDEDDLSRAKPVREKHDDCGIEFLDTSMCVVVDKENKVPKSTRTRREARRTVAPPRPQHHIQLKGKTHNRSTSKDRHKHKI